MPEKPPCQPWFDDRTPYQVAAAVVGTIQKLAGFGSDNDVWQAFGNWRGAELAQYLQAVRRTEHSIFYYQMQYLYEFGMDQVAAADREDFCYRAGRYFLGMVLTETIFPLLQVALAKPGQFQASMVDMIRMYLNRFGGNKYEIRAETRPDTIVLTVSDRFPEQVAEYVRQYGLHPERCFQHSFEFIAGGVDEFAAQVVAENATSPSQFHCSRQSGQILLGVGEGHQFAYERLMQTLLGFTQQVQARLKAQAEEARLESDLFVSSPVMRQAWERIYRASKTDELVLLLGESGTGKTFFARKVHALSTRCKGPFISVCLTSDLGSENLILSNLFGHERGAFTGATGQKQGLFSLAHGGTIFLDEIGDASPELQAKLLHVIETSTFKRLGGVHDLHVDVRVIAATNRDLEQRVRDGQFREDLYYRLNVISIRVPPLRERLESIPALAEFFLNRIALSGRTAVKRLSPAVLPVLQQYPWPGNIRELEHALRHAAALCDRDEIALEDFPAAVCDSLQRKKPALNLGVTAAAETPAIIDVEALRRALRASDPKSAAAMRFKFELPGHIDYAKRIYLMTLIDEFEGNLSLIGPFWDRHSEKTLRALIHAYGLEDHLDAARKRAARKL